GSGKFLCLGVHHLDWRVRLRGPLHPGESNPAAADVRSGGVAHNVWQGLCELGCEADLLSLPALDTRMYMAIEHEDGRLAHGIACLDAYDALDAAFLAQHSTRLKEAALVVVDGNCAADLFADLPAHPCLAFVAVSPAKMGRMAGSLARAKWLFCNRAEYAQLLALDAAVPDGLNIVETRGSAGLALHAGGETISFDAPTIDELSLDETGLGDAMAACILARIPGHTVTDAVTLGLGQFPILVSKLQNNAGPAL
ncbi:MAG: hypothetical protein AAGH82_01825, partial [Pseudomonadota bacterium]